MLDFLISNKQFTLPDTQMPPTKIVLTTLLAFVLFAGVTSPGAAENSVPPIPEQDPEGAVLCSWMIVVAAHAVGKACRPEEDKKFLTFLDGKISEINSFIIRNSDMTMSGIERERHEQESGVLSDSNLCEPTSGGMQIYLNLREVSQEILSQQFSELLKKDRKPLMNPCL